MKNEKIVLWVMVIGILCIVITPYLFTHLGFGVDFTSANTNNIGGTIGGITAPFTGLLGALLVYFALKEQVKANNLIQEQLDAQKVTAEESKVVNYLRQQLEIIINDIDGFHYQSKSLKPNSEIRVVTGSDAISLLLRLYLVEGRPHDYNLSKEVYQIANIKLFLRMIDETVKDIQTENIPEKDKHYLANGIKYQYSTKIKPHFDKLEEHKSSNTEICRQCGIKHYGVPDEFFEIIYSINQRLKL